MVHSASPDVLPPMPHDTKFKQQTLPSYQPILSPAYVISFLGLATVVFIALGVGIILGSDRVIVASSRYDNVNEYSYGHKDAHLQTININGTMYKQGIRTWVKLTIDKTIEAPSYMYYRLTNMFQNHREYRNSRSTLQLRGDDVGQSAMVDCIPYRSPGDESEDENEEIIVAEKERTLSKMTYLPCGIGAWSMFNDTFLLYKVVGDDKVSLPDSVTSTLNTSRLELMCNASDFNGDSERMMLNEEQNPCSKKGIAFEADREEKYKRQTSHADTVWSRNNSEHPSSNLFHQNGWYVQEVGHSLPDVGDEDFQVWMRTAPLSSFKKLLRKIDVDLEAGEYIVEVGEFFDSTAFKGEKHIVVMGSSWIGGRNYFLGIAYIVAGSIAFVMAVGFSVRWKTGSHMDTIMKRIDVNDEETKAYLALKQERLFEEATQQHREVNRGRGVSAIHNRSHPTSPTFMAYSTTSASQHPHAAGSGPSQTRESAFDNVATHESDK